MRRILVTFACLLVAGAAGIALSRARRTAPAAATFRPRPVAGEDLLLLPESERPFARVVIGLLPHGATGNNPFRGTTDPAIVATRRRIYGLDFEIFHGGMMTAVPSYATFFVALPDPATVPEASGEEEGDFRAYLASRLGWSEDTIRARTRFFRVSKPLLYPQDMAEPLGHDAEGRLVLGVGADTDPVYAEPVERLARAFPADFVVRHLAGLHVGDVNTEGGDLALSWLPDGSVGLLVGRHRVIRYLERRSGEELLGRPIPPDRIEETRRAFSAAFYGVEVVIVGEAALRDPSRGSEALFHSDMVVAAVRNASEAVAFVPTYEARPRDANTGELLAEEFARDVQREYNLVAAQMAGRGFRVVRLPFEDHPVRSPVNVSKFVDVSSGRPVVLLARYPDHRITGPGGTSPMAKLRDVILDLQESLSAWQAAPEASAAASLDARLRDAWRALDDALASPNPLFEHQRALYEANGLSVVAFPIVPTGEGGVHCLLMR